MEVISCDIFAAKKMRAEKPSQKEGRTRFFLSAFCALVSQFHSFLLQSWHGCNSTFELLLLRIDR